MELVLNDLSMVGQFSDYEEFEDYFIQVLNPLLEIIAERQIPLYKLPDIFEKEIGKGLTFHQMLLNRNNCAMAAILKKRIIQILDNPFLDGEQIKTQEGISYGYPVKAKEPNCFTEAIERRCPLISFPCPCFQEDVFDCQRDGILQKVPNVKNIKGLLDECLSEVLKKGDIKYILSHYPFSENVVLAETNGKCHTEDALLGNNLSGEDIQKVICHIPDLIRDWKSRKKSHWWDSIEGKICEYRITVSEGREFRIFFLWEKGIVLMNGFVKKTQTTPQAEKKKVRAIADAYRKQWQNRD